MEKIEEACTDGLEVSKQLKYDDSELANNPAAYTEWSTKIWDLIEALGMDALFQWEVDGEMLNMRKQPQADFNERIKKLKSGGLPWPNENGVIKTNPCAYDIWNLKWARILIEASILTDLYSRISPLVPEDSCALHWVYQIAEKMMSFTQDMIRELTQDLGANSIKNYNGEDVEEFQKDKERKAKIIAGACAMGQIPKNDLPYQAIKGMQWSSHPVFLNEATAIVVSSKKEKDLTKYSEYLSEIVAAYQKYRHEEQYPQKESKSTKEEEQTITMLAKSLETVQADLSSIKQGSGGGGGGVKKETRRCYNCHKVGHILPNCPLLQAQETSPPQLDQTEVNWRKRDKPAEGESEICIVDGVKYRYCHKCLNKKGHWTTGHNFHVTADHDPSKRKQSNGDGGKKRTMGRQMVELHC